MPKLLALVLSIIAIFVSAKPLFAEGTYSSLGTGDAADGSADAITFAQGRVWTIDKYGKYIWLTQGRSSTTTHWAWSNDLGANWSQGTEGYSFLTRGSVAYDSKNDKLHVIWAATYSNDGIIYRRYGITRDGSNNITAITREDSSNINLQLDTSSSRTLAQPVALWVDDGSTNGSLIAIWEKYGTSLTEVRASMRKLSLSQADGVAGNWEALDGTADTFATDAPAVAADKIYGSTTAGNAVPAATVRGGTGSKKDDLYVFVAGTDSVLVYRGIWSSGSTNWSGGWQTPITVGQINNTGGGYSFKYELITKPVLDEVNDRLYIGWARWKDNSAGDTVSIAYLSSSDTASSTVDVYSANGTHSYAPTLDIAFDTTLGKLYIAYVQSTTNGDNGSIDYKTYDGSTLSSATRFYTTPGGSAGANGSADIPVLYQSRSSNNRLLFAFRKNGALPPTALNPHTINWGYITLPTPTPTPTNTNTPTPTTNSSYGSLTSAGAPNCNDSKPMYQPILSIKESTQTTVTLSYSGSEVNFSSYALEYSDTESKFKFAVSNFGDKNSKEITIKELSPNTKYYFKLYYVNGCAIGPASTIVAGSTHIVNNPSRNQVEEKTTQTERALPSPARNPTTTEKSSPTPSPTPTTIPLPVDTSKATDKSWLGGLFEGIGRFFSNLWNVFR